MRRVFIYGGCSSRDAVEYYSAYGLELHSYIARQSLISAYRPADPRHFDTSRVASSFQRRMLHGDVVGSMPRHIAAHHESIDLIVWDLMIERVGIHLVRTGGAVTRNGTPRAVGDDAPVFTGSYSFGTDAHLRHWSHALMRFIATLERYELADRVVVNATPWALVAEDGGPSRADSSLAPDFFNANIQPYWDLAEGAGLKVARVPQERAISDPGHKWGPAHFHYVADTHLAQLEELSRIA